MNLTLKHATSNLCLATAKSVVEVDSSFHTGVMNTPSLNEKICVFFYVSTMTGGYWDAFGHAVSSVRSINPIFACHPILIDKLTGFINKTLETTMSNLTAIDPSVISVNNNQLTTTSNNVSDIFGKRHTHILEKIGNLDCSPDFTSANFSAHTVNIEAGAVSRESKYYEMTKDGFMFLVMSFTGKKAAQIKEAYINAFNKMADKLQAEQLTKTPPEQPKTLTSEQCLHIRERVGEMVHAFKDTNFQLQYGKINRTFNKNSYKDILASDYPKLCQFLNCAPKAELVDEEQDHGTIKPLPSPFNNERILFTWENGVLVNSRPMATNEITTTKERILRLVLMHDFTTLDERLALSAKLNADIAQNTRDLSDALRLTRNAR